MDLKPDQREALKALYRAQKLAEDRRHELFCRYAVVIATLLVVAGMMIALRQLL